MKNLLSSADKRQVFNAVAIALVFAFTLSASVVKLLA